MRMTKAGIFILVWATGCGPTPPPIQTNTPLPLGIKPGKPAVSKPDNNGLLTMIRPVVKNLAAEDPFRIALHWATEQGPLERGAVPGGFHWSGTLESMTFEIGTPQGQKLQLKAQPGSKQQIFGGELSHSPTFLLTLTAEGVKETFGGKWAWDKEAQPDLTGPGEYTVRITGAIVREKAEPIPFASEAVSLQLSRDRRSQASIETIARTTLKKQVPQLDPKAPAFIRDDQDGNWLVSYQVSGPMWTYTDYTVAVKSDGAMGGISSREVSTCIARGTPIATESGPKPVEEVQVGELVWGCDLSSRQRVLTTIRCIRVGQAAETLLFGDTLRVTAEHPLWTGDWTPAGHVAEADQFLDLRLRRVPAGVPRRIREPVTVYDLTVEAPHCFFAGGLLVHNKDRAFSAILDDPWYTRWPEHIPLAQRE